MVTTETLQVIINAKDMLTQKIREANNAIRQTGATATMSSSVATSAVTRIGNAYTNLKTRVQSIFQSIRQIIQNSTVATVIKESGLAQPFMNAAEKIRNKWQTLMQNINSTRAKPKVDISNMSNVEQKLAQLKNRITEINNVTGKPRFDISEIKNADGQIQVIVRDLKTISNHLVTLKVNSNGAELKNISDLLDKVYTRAQKVNNTNINPKITTAGLQTLNGQVNSTAIALQKLQNTRFSGLSSAVMTVGNALSTLKTKAVSAFTSIKSGAAGIGEKLSNLASGLSGVQGLMLSAFAAVGVTSMKSFTIEAAIAREKVNAVTKSVTGSEAAFQKANKSIKSAIAGTTLGYNNMATAVNNVALRFHVTGDAVSNLAGPMAKVGILAQAMGKSSEEAASLMEHAFDGLQGRWRQLMTINITEADLKAAGWSGAADDINGYALALDKVIEKKPELKEFTSSFEYQWAILKMSIQGVGTEIGLTILPYLKQILKFLTDLQKNNPGLFKLGVIIGVIVLAITSLATAILPVIMLIQSLGAVIGILASPIVVVVAVIVGLIAILVYLYYTNEDVRNTINAIWETLVGVYEWLSGTFMGIWEWLVGAFTNASNAVTSFCDWLNWLYQTFLSVLPLIMAILLPWTILFDENIRNSAINAVTGFISWISTLPGQLWLWLMDALNKLKQWAVQTILKAKQAGSDMVSGFISWISTLPNKFWSWLLSTINKIISFQSQGAQKIKNAAQKMVEKFKEQVKRLPQVMWDELMHIGDKITNAVGTLGQKMWNLGRNLVANLIGAIDSNSPGIMARTVGYEMGYIQDNIENAIRPAGKLATKLGNSIVTGFEHSEAENINSLISGNDSNLSYTVSHEFIRNDTTSDIYQLLKSISNDIHDIHDGNSILPRQEVEIISDETRIKLSHDVNLENVPNGIGEQNLKQLLIELLSDRDVLRAITSSREFQEMDKRVKTRMLNELSRHI